MKKLFACLALAFAFRRASRTRRSTTTCCTPARKPARRRVVIGNDGRMHVTYSYRDNGRGPDIEEDIALLPDGTFKSYRQTGKTTYGAVLDERFSSPASARAGSRHRTRARRRSRGPRCTCRPTAAPRWTRSSCARRSRRAARMRRCRAASSGARSSRTRASGRPARNAQSRCTRSSAPACSRITSGSTRTGRSACSPASTWAGATSSSPATSGGTRARDDCSALRKRSTSRDIAKKHTQSLPQPILIKNVRVFDTEKNAPRRAGGRLRQRRSHRRNLSGGLAGEGSRQPSSTARAARCCRACSTCTRTRMPGTRSCRLRAASRPRATWATTTPTSRS